MPKSYIKQNPKLSVEIEAAVRQQAASGEVPLTLGGGGR